MQHNALEQKIQRWADEFAAAGDKDARDKIKRTLHQLSFLETKLFFNYEPSRPPNAGYMQRLTAWLDNLPDEGDQRLALDLAAELFYVGRTEINALHRAAFAGPVRNWLGKLHQLSFRDDMLSQKLEQHVNRTWFGPITDSMKINEFVHLNQIVNGIDYRTDWQSLARFPNLPELNAYIDANQIEQIVLLEDFIATGSQAKNAIQFAAALRPVSPIPVLVVPLISCPKAKENFVLMNFPPHVTIVPVIQLQGDNFVSTNGAENSSKFNQILALAAATYLQVSGGVPPSNDKPYGPLGFQDTGGLVVLDTNTPDNTLPLVHWRSDTWKPLFPRHSRV